MNNIENFQVYNASAGSGKTFSLVKEYLKIILKNDNHYSFQHILAITFTNKAASEMKERIIDNLHLFSQKKENEILHIICSEINIRKNEIFEKSKHILTAILQNYSAFSVTTIDSFTHKIIRTFAYDLGLSLTFDVEMNSSELLKEAVDNVISKIGIDTNITQTLIAYALQKTDDDKTWDVSYDLYQFSTLLINENHNIQLKKIQDVDISEFQKIKKYLLSENVKVKAELKKIGKKALQIIEENNLNFNDFYRSMLPNHFKKLAENPKSAKFFDQSTLKERVEDSVFYSKSKPNDIKNSIDQIIPQLILLYESSEKAFQQITKNSLIVNNLVPLAVLKYINQSLQSLKLDKNIMLNAEFNQIISESIKDEPAPFIYERLGEKYKHYFIDEMQDTSILQWQNIIPLILNTLTSENEKGSTGSLLLVGDAKQSIYRWRGGKAEQFIALSSSKNNRENNPFFVPKKVENLTVNYRSYSEIIRFNNSFFSHIAHLFSNTEYQKLFIEGNKQKTNKKEGGYVEVSFVEKEKDDDDKHLVFAKKVLEIIKKLESSFQKEEICVLVRSNKQGVEVADYLTENGIQIVSSETLLLQNNEKVRFIVDLLELVQNSENKKSKLKVLYFLHRHLSVQESKHTFLQKHIHLNHQLLFESLKNYNLSFSVSDFMQLPLYESIEYIIQHCKLAEKPSSEIQFFLDLAFEHSQKRKSSLSHFLEFWNAQKHKLSVATPEVGNAVKIMTIHKSKGLEFPVVIFPYDLDIYRSKNEKVWYQNNDFVINPILLDCKKDLTYIDKQGEFLYSKHTEELELDNFNLLYVALTRASEQLYIVQEQKLSPKNEENRNFSSGLFIHFLKSQNLWDKNTTSYHFGSMKRKSILESEKRTITEPKKSIHYSWKEHKIKIASNPLFLKNESIRKAVLSGNLLHEILSKIKTHRDINSILQQYFFTGLITSEERKEYNHLLQKITQHNDLKDYFSSKNIIFNERKIISKNGSILIPDRLIFNNKNVKIIDYKTGNPQKKYIFQINQYADVLKEMGYEVKEKILLYINLEDKNFNFKKI